MRVKTAVLRWGSWWSSPARARITQRRRERWSLGMAFMQSEHPRPGGRCPDPCDVSAHDDVGGALGKQSRTRSPTVH